MLFRSCLILTSEDENFANVVAEALSNGLSCILSSKVALSSLIKKYDAGIVFESLQPEVIAKAIFQMSKKDKNLAQSAALRAASELDWDKVALNWNSHLEIIFDS